MRNKLLGAGPIHDSRHHAPAPIKDGRGNEIGHDTNGRVAMHGLHVANQRDAATALMGGNPLMQGAPSMASQAPQNALLAGAGVMPQGQPAAAQPYVQAPALDPQKIAQAIDKLNLSEMAITALLSKKGMLTMDDVNKTVGGIISSPTLPRELRNDFTTEAISGDGQTPGFLTLIQERAKAAGRDPAAVDQAIRGVVMQMQDRTLAARHQLAATVAQAHGQGQPQGMSGGAFNALTGGMGGAPAHPQGAALAAQSAAAVEGAHKHIDRTIQGILALTNSPEGSLSKQALYEAARKHLETPGAFHSNVGRKHLITQLASAPDDEPSLRKTLGTYLMNLAETRKQIEAVHGPRGVRRG